MPTTFIIDKESTLYKNNMLENTTNRLKQYKNGINKVLELNKKYNIDIYIADNGLNFENKIKINSNIKLLSDNPNNYGKYNKGAGLIEIWRNNIEILKQYDYIIHFEPRQLLIDNYFIDNFMKNPRTLFTYNHIPCPQKHFNTGLFSCKTAEILKFINEFPPEFLVKKALGIEHALYYFYNNNKIQYDTLDKMSLIWYDTAAKKEWIW
jgi:hypothetical protein